MGVVTVVEIVGIRERKPELRGASGQRLVHQRESIRSIERQRFDEQGVGEARDGAVEAKTERQRGDGGGRKTWRPPHPTNGVPHILAEQRHFTPPRAAQAGTMPDSQPVGRPISASGCVDFEGRPMNGQRLPDR
jgi:hypothetical protein